MTFGDGFGHPTAVHGGLRVFNQSPMVNGEGMIGGRQTYFDVGDKINDVINIDEHDSDDGDIDFDKYSVNMDTGDQKRKYKILERYVLGEEQ